MAENINYESQQIVRLKSSFVICWPLWSLSICSYDSMELNREGERYETIPMAENYGYRPKIGHRNS